VLVIKDARELAGVPRVPVPVALLPVMPAGVVMRVLVVVVPAGLTEVPAPVVPAGVTVMPDSPAPVDRNSPVGVLVRLHMLFHLSMGSKIACAWSIVVFVMAAS
jgi:hypothetical protein